MPVSRIIRRAETIPFYRRIICQCLIIAMGSLTLVSCSNDKTTQARSESKSSSQFNIVMIVSDALRQDVLGCYGGEAKTPNIDWLAEHGMLFENAYSTSPWTVPSSVSMFTGNYPTTYKYAPFAESHESGIPNISKSIQVFVPDQELLLVEYLKQQGYQTAMKVENPHARLHNNLQGLDTLPSINEYRSIMSQEVQTQLKEILATNLDNSQAYMQSQLFLNYLLNAPVEKNFFALHWMIDPHGPYEPIDKFKERIVADPQFFSRDIDFYKTTLPPQEIFSDAEKKFNKDLYLAEVESVDERVGFIIKILQHRNLLQRTIIVFTSDHGEQFGEHGQYGHGGFGRDCNYYDTLIKIPLIIAAPQFPQGKTITTPVSHIDLMPTLKEMLGLTYQDKMQGKSFLQLLTTNKMARPPLYFSDVRSHEQIDALLQDNFKLIALKNNHFEMYNLEDDPAEMINIATTKPDLKNDIFAVIEKAREQNQLKKQKNLQLPDNKFEQSEEEKKETIKKLKALGYIK